MQNPKIQGHGKSSDAQDVESKATSISRLLLPTDTVSLNTRTHLHDKVQQSIHFFLVGGIKRWIFQVLAPPVPTALRHQNKTTTSARKMQKNTSSSKQTNQAQHIRQLEECTCHSSGECEFALPPRTAKLQMVGVGYKAKQSECQSSTARKQNKSAALRHSRFLFVYKLTIQIYPSSMLLLRCSYQRVRFKAGSAAVLKSLVLGMLVIHWNRKTAKALDEHRSGYRRISRPDAERCSSGCTLGRI